ncbi:MAG: hybrid sensor histidine kinase/response regulator [Kiritimatiellia bacterium]|jgi:two-component system sensor histidine kinase and response regulator WspE
MTTNGGQDLSSFSMLDLFRQETEAQTAILNEGLLALEQDPGNAERLAAMMRAAHSLKGAARIVNLDPAVKVAHALEDCFVAAQKGAIVIQPEAVDGLLSGVDMLSQIARVSEAEAAAWQAGHQTAIDELTARLAAIRSGQAAPGGKAPEPAVELGRQKRQQKSWIPDQVGNDKQCPAHSVIPAKLVPDFDRGAGIQNAPLQFLGIETPAPAESPASVVSTQGKDRAVRVSSDNLNRMLGMMGEYMVQTRWFEPFAAGLQALKNRQNELARLLEQACTARNGSRKDSRMAESSAPAEQVADLRHKLDACRQATAQRLEEFDFFAQQSSDLAERLYREGLISRMRPFADGIQGFPRMVRDLARRLNKKVKFEMVGQTTGVDREILEKLEAPLTHLLRNALDHGLEPPEERRAAGKNPEGLLTLAARHQAGQLHVIVADDGRGIDLERIRRKVAARGLSTAEMAARLTETELLDFLFLPGFSTSEAVTEISGRGVGLDVVRNLTQEVGGLVRVENHPGAGTQFHLQLPITLSVLRTLLVEIAGDPYAIPLTRIDRLVTAAPEEIQTLEGRRYLTLDQRHIGLVDAREVLELSGAGRVGAAGRPAAWSIVIIGERANAYGLVVDRFIGESKLVVRTLDARLGKVRDVSAVSLLDDGAPVMILDTEDLVRSIENLLSGGRLKQFQAAGKTAAVKTGKHILVADDSITVREMERKLLENRGYTVDVAVDGMDAWNTVRMGRYDLVVSDVDMPRMNGIELVRRIKQDVRLQALPVIVVSYKDRPEDRLSGLEAGAAHYLTKSSFHDETFLKTVADTIGDP